MPYVLTRFKVEDYAKWKSGFSGAEGTAMRKPVQSHTRFSALRMIPTTFYSSSNGIV